MTSNAAILRPPGFDTLISYQTVARQMMTHPAAAGMRPIHMTIANQGIPVRHVRLNATDIAPLVNETPRQYVRHLRQKATVALSVAISSLIVAWFSLLDLILFTELGKSVIHPLLDFFLIVTSFALTAVALISLRVTSRYFGVIIERTR